MLTFLRPHPTLTEGQTQRSLRLMAWQGLASSAMLSLGSGGFMAAYALALGANNLEVGILAALPFLSQVVRLPVILLVERFRARVTTSTSWIRDILPPGSLASYFARRMGMATAAAAVVGLGGSFSFSGGRE